VCPNRIVILACAEALTANAAISIVHATSAQNTNLNLLDLI
jgi:hypothetical protein